MLLSSFRFNKYGFILAAVLASGFVSCKKEKNSTGTTASSSSVDTAAAANSLKDSVLLYTRDVYLWYDQIPGKLNVRSYADPDKIMTAIRQYSVEPGFSKPVDRWSFAMKQQEWNNVSSGVSGDFGLGVFFMTEGDLRVKSVEKASPAGKAGIRRGWRITKLNGDNAITTSNASSIISKVYQSTTTTFTFQKPDNSVVDITLNAATYQEHPVFLDTVYNVNAKNVGYLVFNSFLGDTTEIYNQFATILNRFTQQNVSDVVVDIRYNGGGYVTVQQKLADYLVNAAANGNLMMKQQFNNKNSQYNSSLNFTKLGSLNVNRIFFIVSNGTASASELLINNLKPYMDVKLVGPNNTYGKPVGFFPIPVGDWYIFPVSFRSTNKNGEGNYFNGIAVNSQVGDGLDKDWGDVTESCLASALKYIASGSFRVQAPAANEKAYVEHPEVTKGNEVLDQPSFKGAIQPRPMFK